MGPRRLRTLGTRLWRWGEDNLTLEGQEQLLALMLEPHGALVDGLADCMDADEGAAFRIDGAMSIATLRDLVTQHYDWALALDFDDPAAMARFWYVSEEKLEPRMGKRHSEAGAERELPLAASPTGAGTGARSGEGNRADGTVAAFLLAHPQHRLMVRRVQIVARYPFAEVRDNLVDQDMLPIDLLRCKLAFFGAHRGSIRDLISGCGSACFRASPIPTTLRRGKGMSRTRYSLSEIEAVCLKAARGAGFDWGIAEEAGFAARDAGADGAWPGLRLLLACLSVPRGAWPVVRSGEWHGTGGAGAVPAADRGGTVGSCAVAAGAGCGLAVGGHTLSGAAVAVPAARRC